MEKKTFLIFSPENRNFLIITLISVMALLGCTTQQVRKVDWQALSGSRSDATVTLVYAYNPQTDIPAVDDMQALQIAKKRCSSWGYHEVEPFGGIGEQCVKVVPGFGYVPPACVNINVTKTYQCLGRGDSLVPTDSLINNK